LAEIAKKLLLYASTPAPYITLHAPFFSKFRLATARTKSIDFFGGKKSFETHVEVSTDGEEEKVGDEKSGHAVAHQVSEPEFEKVLHLFQKISYRCYKSTLRVHIHLFQKIRY
jgi:hypothetical protein